MQKAMHHTLGTEIEKLEHIYVFLVENNAPQVGRSLRWIQQRRSTLAGPPRIIRARLHLKRHTVR